jgi:hypothetical protein
LEPARALSLSTQEEDVNLIKMVDSIDGTRKRYQRLLNRVTKEPETVYELPRVKALLLKVKSSDFFNKNSDTVTTYKYQDIVLSYFTQAKTKLVHSAPKILKSICECFDRRYGNLTMDSKNKVSSEETATQSDILLRHMCKVLNTSCWIVPKEVETSVALEMPCKSIETIYDHYKEMNLIKSQSIDELKEQYLQVVEYTKQYHKVELFEPLDMWSLLNQRIGKRFPDIFHFIELCLCAPYSNATVERFFNYMKIVKTDWRSKLNESNLESLLRIKVQGPNLNDFAETLCPKAVHLWRGEKERRVNQGKRKKYKARKTKSKRRRFTNSYIDEFLGLSSSDEGTDEENEEDDDIEFQVL